MNSSNETISMTIHTNEYGGKYYILNGVKYHISFPLPYALSHKRGTGPEECGNCADFGSIGFNKVFLGYCGNCAGDYDYSCGLGLDENGIEFPGFERSSYIRANTNYDDEFIPFNKENVSKNSIYNTYLKDTTREELLKQFPTTYDCETDVADEPFPEHLSEHLPYCRQEFLRNDQSTNTNHLVNVIDDEDEDRNDPTPEKIQSWLQDPATFNWEYSNWNDAWDNQIQPATPNAIAISNSTQNILAMARGLLQCKSDRLFNPTPQKKVLEQELVEELVEEESEIFDAIEEAIQKGHIGLR